MTKEEKIMRRSLHWAAEYRRSGDADGEAGAMQRYRRAESRVSYAYAAAVSPRIDIVGVSR